MTQTCFCHVKTLEMYISNMFRMFVSKDYYFLTDYYSLSFISLLELFLFGVTPALSMLDY